MQGIVLQGILYTWHITFTYIDVRSNGICCSMRNGRKVKKISGEPDQYGSELSRSLIQIPLHGWNMPRWRWGIVLWITLAMSGTELYPFYQERISCGTNTFIWRRCLAMFLGLVKFLSDGWSGSLITMAGLLSSRYNIFSMSRTGFWTNMYHNVEFSLLMSICMETAGLTSGIVLYLE